MKNLFLLLTLFLAAGVYAQKATLVNDSFKAGKYMSKDEGMSIEAYFALGDNLYAGIGEYRGTGSPFFKYSIANNTWTKLKDFSGDFGDRYGAISFTANGKGYFGLGTSTTKDTYIWEYNPTDDSWSKFSSFPGGSVEHAAVFIIDNFVYVGSGYKIEDPNTDFWKLNLTTKEWTKIASTPKSLWGGAGFTINGKGYIAGGKDLWGYRNQLLEYDPQQDKWTVKLTDSQKLNYCYARAAVINNEAYIFYGDICQFSKYNPGTNSITKLNDFIGLNEERYDALCIPYNGSIYYGLGTYNNVNYWATYPQDLWKYTISGSTGIEKIDIADEITIFPNPASTYIQVKSENPIERLEIFDTNGKLLSKSNKVDNVDLSNLINGCYFIKLYLGKYSCVKKILIIK